MGGWGLGPRKIFQKINVEIAHFQAFLQAKNKMVWQAHLTLNPYLQISAILCRYL